MKRIVLFTFLSSFLVGCNPNPNKEERIQKLETEIQEARKQIKDLDNRVEELERENVD